MQFIPNLLQLILTFSNFKNTFERCSLKAIKYSYCVVTRKALCVELCGSHDDGEKVPP